MCHTDWFKMRQPIPENSVYGTLFRPKQLIMSTVKKL